MAHLENFRLTVFRAVAEHLNFRKAAEQLFLTQPAVTLQIKALENDLGMRLFDRTGGKITLTRHGSVLIGFANQLASLASEAERELGCSEGTVSGDLALAASTTIAQYVLPRLIGALQNEYPKIQFSLHSGNTSEVVRYLLEGKVSLGLIEGPAHERGVRTEPFMEDELVLITPPGFDSDRLSPAQFVATSLLMREQGSGSRRVVGSCKGRLQTEGLQKSHGTGFYGSDQVRSGSWAGCRLCFALGAREGVGVRLFESRASQRHPSHSALYPHFADRSGTARPCWSAPHICSRSCPPSLSSAQKPLRAGDSSPISRTNR